MEMKSVVILNRKEIEEGLINFHVDLLQDKTYVRETLQGSPPGGLHIDIITLSESELIDLYATLCVGEQLLKKLAEDGHPPVDYVVFQKENGDMLYLCQKEQNLPKQWKVVA